jgi:uncharacterized protein YnzC (UPF0291/DUF896 family)
MQLKEANDNARKSEQKLKDYEAKIESMQGTLMQFFMNVLARMNELAATKEQSGLTMVEQTNKNERLQSELDRAKKETSDSFAKANVKVTQERGLTACRGEVDKNPSPEPEKGKIVEGNVSGDKKQILPPKKTKYSPKAFNDNGSGDKGITPDKNKGSQETAVQSMVKVSKDFWNVRSTRSDEVGPKETTGLSPQHHKIYNGMILYLIIAVDLLIQVFAENLGIIDSTIWFYGVLLIATVCFDMGIGVYHEGKVENAMQSFKMTKQGSDVNDITNSGTGHFPVVATDVALASGCGVFECISMCDSTTETILQCIWHKIYDGFIYLIITVDLLVHVFAANRGIADSTIRLYFALLIATACFNIGICIYHAGNVVENANTSYKTMEKKLDTKDCAISGTGLIAEESTSGALACNCDIFAPKSTHDLTTQTLCRCMWHKWLAFCVYNTSLVNFFAAYLTLNGCKKHVTALVNTFFGWTGARMSTYVFETNECIANSFTAKFTAMKHTISHVLSSASHLLVPHMTPVKLQRRRLFERRSSIIMLAVVFIVSIIAETEGQQVSLQFYFVLSFCTCASSFFVVN